jgi:hypothetical protein
MPAVLKLLPLVLVPIAFFASIPWLKTLSAEQSLLITAAVATFVIGYANYFTFRYQQGLDEVESASVGFAAQWGVPAGQALFVLLLLFPPFQAFATSVVNQFITEFANNPGATVDRTAVILAMALAFCSIVVLQTIGTLVVYMFWWKSRL